MDMKNDLKIPLFFLLFFDSWTIFDSSTNRFKIEERESADYESSDGALTLSFKGTPDEEYPGFTAIITAYTGEFLSVCEICHQGVVARRVTKCQNLVT